MKKLKVQWSEDIGTKIPIRILGNPTKPAQSKRIPLDNILENMFHIGEIDTPEKMDELIEGLKKLPPDMVIISEEKLEEQLGAEIKQTKYMKTDTKNYIPIKLSPELEIDRAYAISKGGSTAEDWDWGYKLAQGMVDGLNKKVMAEKEAVDKFTEKLTPKQLEAIEQARKLGPAMLKELNRAKEAGEEIY